MRAHYGDRYEVFSAGTEPSGIDPVAVGVMKEMGIDISGNRSKPVSDFSEKTIDTVVTLCDSAREDCPFFPGLRRIMHESIEDPADLTGADEEIHMGYRMIRNEITRWIDVMFAGKKSST